MAYAKATIIARIRRLLDDLPMQEVVSATTGTSITVADATLYDRGDIIEFSSDGDRRLVSAASGTTLTVVNGIDGSTAASHTSELMYKNPVFSYGQITDAITTILTGLYPYVYRAVTVSLTPLTNGNKYYELTTASGADKIIELSQVSQEIGTGATSSIFFYGDRPRAYPVILYRDIPTTKVASGVGLYIPFLRDNSNAIIVQGIAELDDTVATSNYSYLTDGLEVECVIFYVVSQLIAMKDIPRATQQDTNMYDASVKPFARSQLAMVWEQRALQKRRQWERKLAVKTPRLKKWNR